MLDTPGWARGKSTRPGKEARDCHKCLMVWTKHLEGPGACIKACEWLVKLCPRAVGAEFFEMWYMCTNIVLLFHLQTIVCNCAIALLWTKIHAFQESHADNCTNTCSRQHVEFKTCWNTTYISDMYSSVKQICCQLVSTFHFFEHVVSFFEQ